MQNYTIRKYNYTNFNEWNSFIETSKNGTFLFHRDFMEYHQDRFEDFSLMIYKGNKLLAILPANVKGKEMFSHQGLTYGGLLIGKKIKFKDILEMMKSILFFLEQKNIKSLFIKQIPLIYNTTPSDEMEYLLFILKSKLERRDLLSVIELTSDFLIKSNRIEGVKKAKKQSLLIKEENDLDSFWNQILIPNLKEKHNATPVHSLKEISFLKENFPKKIRQFNVYNGTDLVGGATIFETKTVAHVQYISANNKKQTLGTLDFLFNFLLNEVFENKKYFDFGTSNKENGLLLNKGLHSWKEDFGARGIVQNFYKIDTKNYSLLDNCLF